ncbi:hypothetical protein SUGI_0766360 [Cryptomeria japonica]|uniref:uncharacterized protein LOC131078498 isoform X1 n=1 Tax=Cryptomeria japonica TaxID=3369 RepID=UPI002414BA19|nr:uncharacterized protein LOC131078498 isoform X1 [Cryptomeria japonica]GLJ37721.1 hypothetical protein SUGI_0766360 [Cryptomeria japonica]
MEANVPDYRRIVVRGRTALEQAGHFTIRVFAQIQGVSGDSMASQGDVGCCYVNVEDACETGCVAACERASYNAHSASAKQDCTMACIRACVRPDIPLGRFTTTVPTNK